MAQINIDEIISRLREIFKAEFASDSQQVKDTVESYLTETKIRLELYANLAATEEISPTFLVDMLKEEKSILESRALSLEVIGKVQAQSSINKIFITIGAWIAGMLMQQVMK